MVELYVLENLFDVLEFNIRFMFFLYLKYCVGERYELEFDCVFSRDFKFWDLRLIVIVLGLVDFGFSLRSIKLLLI